jgi:hypothetical protein
MNKKILLWVPLCCLVDAFKIIPNFFVKQNSTRNHVIKNPNEQKKYIDGLFSNKNIIDTVVFLLF